MPWRLEKKAERIGKYYDRSQPRKCCSSLSLRNRNRKCWIWNLYFRCSRHCRVYRINWYNNTKKLVKSQWLANIMIDPNLVSAVAASASEAGTGNAESETTSGAATAESTEWIDTTTQKKISWNYNCWPILWSIPNSAASEAGTGNVESEILTSSAAARPLQTLPNKLIQQQRSCRIIGTFYIPKRKNSWNHHKEGTHRKILTRKIKKTRKHNTPYYYLLDAFVYLLNNCCDTQFINFSASNWKKNDTWVKCY